MNTASRVLAHTATGRRNHPGSNAGRQWPLWAWIAVLLMVNLPLLWGEVRHGWLYLPEAAAGGQWWRMITYPLVHLSWYHLLLDAGGFLLLFFCLEEKRKLVKTVYLIGAGAGTLLLAAALDPFLSQRGLCGLSGIAHGLMAISALEMLRHKGQRQWGLFSLAVVVAKSAYELWSGHVVFEFMHMGLCGQPLAASHAGGVMGGMAAYLIVNTPFKRFSMFVTGVSGQEKNTTAGQDILRMFAKVLSRTFYRVRRSGLAHIPASGPAVLVCNHVSYIDWLFIAGACKRPVHFVMHASYCNRMPLLGWLFKTAGVIPIVSGRENPAMLRRAFGQISTILQSGGLVCIFPEGSLTRTGRINSFRNGIETIIHRTPVPVIPLALGGLWGSFFSHQGGRAMHHWPRRIWRRIELAAGAGFEPQQVSACNLQQAVQHLCRSIRR